MWRNTADVAYQLVLPQVNGYADALYLTSHNSDKDAKYTALLPFERRTSRQCLVEYLVKNLCDTGMYSVCHSTCTFVYSAFP